MMRLSIPEPEIVYTENPLMKKKEKRGLSRHEKEKYRFTTHWNNIYNENIKILSHLIFKYLVCGYKTKVFLVCLIFYYLVSLNISLKIEHLHFSKSDIFDNNKKKAIIRII